MSTEEPQFRGIGMMVMPDGEKRVSLVDLIDMMSLVAEDKHGDDAQAAGADPLMMVTFAMDMMPIAKIVAAILEVRSQIATNHPTYNYRDFEGLDSIVQFLKDAEADNGPMINPMNN